MFRTVKNLSVLLGTVLLVSACGEKNPSFSLLSETDNFVQSDNKLTAKMDILWVIDNSGSMQTSQENLASNFEAFISGFSARNFDYQMAVTTTEAYRGIYLDDDSYSRFKSDGGVAIMTPSTPNLETVFIQNVLQGTRGSGDERAFQSFKEALNNPYNAGFVREDSFLAIIIVSDEEDSSHDDSNIIFDPADPRLHSPESYLEALDSVTNSSGATRRYSVSSMAIQDQDCRDALNAGDAYFKGRQVGLRYAQLADLTDGKKGDLCGDFTEQINQIAGKILETATQYYLSRIPHPETIVVVVNGEVVPNINANAGPKLGGWSYNADANSVMFHGDYIPAQGSTISINFDPVKYGE